MLLCIFIASLSSKINVSLVMDINISQQVLASMSGRNILLLSICDFHIRKNPYKPRMSSCDYLKKLSALVVCKQKEKWFKDNVHRMNVIHACMHPQLRLIN